MFYLWLGRSVLVCSFWYLLGVVVKTCRVQVAVLVVAMFSLDEVSL